MLLPPMSKLRTQRVPRICSASRVCCSFTSFASSTSLFFSRHSSLATRHFLLAAILLLLSTRSAVALDPSLDISQYAHTSWKMRGGFTKGAVGPIAQTPDGYLWLGTEFGLLQFDGHRTVPWQPPAGEQLPSNNIWDLLVARDGTLWIATLKGLVSWKDRKFTNYAEVTGQRVWPLLQDREGTIWFGAYSPSRLCAVQSGKIQCYGAGSFGSAVGALYEDPMGSLWVSAATGLWQWKPGPPKQYTFPRGVIDVGSLIEVDDGTLVLATNDGLKQLVGGKIRSYALPGINGNGRPTRFLRSSDGSLWVGTQQGLLHLHQGRVDTFGIADGLSGDLVERLFEDHEGNVWVSTQDGLDRFREYAIPRVSRSQGLASSVIFSVQATMDGTIWVGASNSLNRWRNGVVTVYGRRGAPGKNVNRSAEDVSAGRAVTKIGDGELTGTPRSLGKDDRERFWVSTNSGVFYLDGNRFTRVVGFQGRNTYPGIAGDGRGNVWIGDGVLGLFHLTLGHAAELIPWSTFGNKEFGAQTFVPDRADGGLWLGFINGGIAYFKGGQARASYSAANGLGNGRVDDLRFDSHGVLWAATEGGLSRIEDGHISTLTSKNALPCDTVHWSVEDGDHFVWLYMPCGLVRIAPSELDAWMRDPKRTIQTRVFDASDGVRSIAIYGGYGPHVTKAPDGRIWFVSLDGISVIDPRHLPYNKVSPPVHIEQITADGKVYDASAAGSGRLRLPARIRNLDIDYTALSLVIPEKVRFRVKLEGQDTDWRELVNVRHVEYTNLAPKTYRFLVKAANNDGVWNEAGAALDFTIPPMWYQTGWFRALCLAALLAFVWALYQLRVRQLAAQFNMRLDARVSERTRIARDLHDTLLQSFHGILLRMQILSNELPNGNTKEKLDIVIDEAEHAIVEGRDAVQGLRASTVERNDLAAAIRTLGEELAAADSSSHRPEFSVQIEGAPCNLHPILRDEVYRIAGEAMRNAFRHAGAQRIEVEIRYDDRQLRVRVRDDGKGIDLELLGDNGREGHFGLRGMRERAKLIGGKLTVWSELDSGTEVELTIPAARAYVTAPERRRLVEKLTGKLTGKTR